MITRHEIVKNMENWRDCSPDQPPCAICKMPILDMPMRLETNNKEISFHFGCAMDGDFPEEEEAEFLEGADDDVYCYSCDDLMDCPHVHENLKKAVKKDNIFFNIEH